MNKFPILIFAGFSGAGKSTISRKVAEGLGLNFIEHQKMVHEIAVSKGYERARYWLADVGVGSFVRESEEEMVRRMKFLEESRGIVLDVAYSKNTIEKIKDTFPEAHVVTISVSVAAATRGERIQGRMAGTSIEEAQRERDFRDAFLKESGVDSAIEVADIKITNLGNLEQSVSEVLRKLESL